MKARLISYALMIVLVASNTAFSDYKISQRTTIEDVSSEVTIWAKGVRERRETKMDFGAENMEGVSPEMIASMMPPSLTTISQCDLKQDVTLNDKAKLFFIDYYDWSAVPAEKLARRPAQKVVIKGTVTISSTVTDSGKRQTMFGLPARWLKTVRSFESSADSCDGAANMRMEEEGWYVDLQLNRQSCPVAIPPAPDAGGCRPRVIVKSAQDGGFFLEGTTTTYQDGKKVMTTKLETTALSKAPLDQALFEVPKDYTEADSLSELMRARPNVDMTAITQVGDKRATSAGGKAMKTVAIDFFSGSSSKLDQSDLRNFISSKLSAAGISGYVVTSQADLQTGNFANVISVDIGKAKESGAAKIGGLFGKVTGTGDASKAGSSEAEITVTVYAQDRKTVVVSVPVTEKVKGNSNDAVRAALEKAMPSVIAKLK